MKNKVLALAKKQNAKVEVLDPYGDGQIEVCVALPDGKIWDNGYEGGIVVVTKEDGQTMAAFWESIYDEINAPVISSN